VIQTSDLFSFQLSNIWYYILNYYYHVIHYSPRTYLSYALKFTYFNHFILLFLFWPYFFSLSNYSFKKHSSRTYSVPENKIHIVVEKIHFRIHTIGQTHNNNSKNIHTDIHKHTVYIYIYVCVCVCVYIYKIVLWSEIPRESTNDSTSLWEPTV